MNTSTKSTRISAVFLSAVLIAGTIAALFPSFMIGAQADPYYGMDKDHKKVDKKISVSSLKCNNINVNVNGLTLDVFPPSLAGGEVLASAAEEANTGASSYPGNGGSDGGAEFKNFKFVCINNNNNTVVQEPIPPVPPVEGCEECFDDLTVDLQVLLNAALEEGFTIGPLVVEANSTLADLCEQLELVGPLEISGIDILGFILENIDSFTTIEDIASFINLLVCLQDLDLIDVDIFGLIDLLQQNGILPAGSTPESLGITS